jgi:ribulose 1,5-bisphosphate synthetase/thiazole synthase
MLRSILQNKRTAVAATLGSLFNAHHLSTAAAQGEAKKSFDLIVIGGGSGGIACAKRAASYGATGECVHA